MKIQIKLMKMQIQLMKMQIQLKRHRYFCKYTVLPLEWHPPNTNPIDKNTNTIDEDANTQIFLQIHSSSTRLAPSKPGLICLTCRWQQPTSSQIVAEKKLSFVKKKMNKSTRYWKDFSLLHQYIFLISCENSGIESWRAIELSKSGTLLVLLIIIF